MSDQPTTTEAAITADDTCNAIAVALANWRAKHRREFDGVIQMSVQDLRDIDNDQKIRQRALNVDSGTPVIDAIESNIMPGDSGMIMGVAVRAENWAPGNWWFESRKE